MGAPKTNDPPRWTMPPWMKPYAKLFTNTGREVRGPETIEELYNGHTSPIVNLPLSTIEAMQIAQAGLLYNLHRDGLLRTPE